MKTIRDSFYRALMLAAALVLVSGSSIATGCKSASGEAETEIREGHEEGEHGEAGEEEGEEEEEEEDDLSMSTEDILSARCEHDTHTYECDECRYEVGVVKVDPSVIKSASNEAGLIGLGAVSTQRIKGIKTITGEVRLNTNLTARINSPVSGIVGSIEVELGDKAETGQLLARIESGELGEIVGDYKRSRSMTELSRKTYLRERGLYKKEISSEQDMIEARMNYEENSAELKALEKKLEVLGIDKDELNKKLGSRSGFDEIKLEIRSPLAGTVIEKSAAAGELVDEGREIMVVSDLSKLWVWADVYEKDLGPLLEASSGEGLEVEVVTMAFADRAFKGRIDYIGATMDESTRTVKVRATVDNTGGLLRPGMFCEINVPLGSEKEVTAVPKGAVLFDEDRAFIFKHLKDDYYLRREIEKGREFDGMVEILEGAQSGETIVIDGAFLLKSDVLREKMGAGCAD